MSTTTTTPYTSKDDALSALRSGEAKARAEVVAQAKAEHTAQKAAKAAGTEIPAAPALDALNEDSANGTRKRTAKQRIKGTDGGAGRTVNLTDDALVHEVIPELWGQGHRTVGAMVKALRGTERGTNPKRFAKAFAAAVDAKVIDPETAKAEAPAKATKAAKAAPKKAAAKKATAKEVTPRPKRATGDKTASAMGAEDEVAKRRSTRARKAS